MTKRVKSPSSITEEENDQKRIRGESTTNSTLLNIRGGDITTTSTDSNMQTTEGDNKPSWGDYLGGWKLGDTIDQEAERIHRQKAAFGHETIARLKDLNVLIIGCGGVGVETAKNLILSNEHRAHATNEHTGNEINSENQQH